MLFLFLLMACDQGVEPDSRIKATWIWVSSSGGFAGETRTPVTTGEEIQIVIDAKRFKKYINSVLEEDLKYTVAREKSIYSTEPVQVITFSNGWRQSYEINNDALILKDECYDCYLHVYRKE